MERVTIGLPGDDLSDRVVVDGPVDCRGEPLDLGQWCSATEHGAACVPPCPAAPDVVVRTKDDHGRSVRVAQWVAEIPVGPATRADLEDLDAVPEPVDSAAPAVTYLPGARPIGPDAQTRPIRRPR